MTLDEEAAEVPSGEYTIIYESPRTVDSQRALRSFFFPSCHRLYLRLSPLERDVVDYMELYSEDASKVSRKVALLPAEVRRLYRSFVNTLSESGINIVMQQESEERICTILHTVRQPGDWN